MALYPRENDWVLFRTHKENMTSFMNESGETISTYVGDEISDDREAKNVFGTNFFVSG